MPITGVSQSLNLSGSSDIYFNHPAQSGMSDGYWFYYTASAANNTKAAKIKPYRWSSPLNTNEAGDFLTMEGSIVLVSESLNRQRIFHGSTITRVGGGTNVQTGLLEDDAFFFYHMGDLDASDDIGYWDYAYIAYGGTEWDYFQYHQHNPNAYEDFDNGRIAMGSQTYINVSDKRYAYLQPFGISVMGTPYTSVLARIHQPSIGGAHSSHNDVQMPSVSNKNYMPAGIIEGTSNRFHAFYISSGSGANWNIYGRTYVLASDAFTAEVNYGEYPLAIPTFTTTTGTGLMERYPFRASSGILYDTTCYVPVIYSGSAGTFDLKIWSFNSANTVQQSAVTITNLVTGSTQRPDIQLTKAGTKLTALVSDINNGGVDFYILSGSTWINEGNLVTNGTGDILRIHGFNYNSADSKFYALLSGNVTGSAAGVYSGSYSGSGVYSFSDNEVFSGYEHISYITGSYGFKLQAANTNGYLRYENANGGLYYYSGSEPQGIADTERILVYDKASPIFYSKVDTKVIGDERYFHGLRLDDGRLIGVGIIENNIFNRGAHDLLMAIYSDTGTNPEFIAAGGDNDDYFTGIIEDRQNKNLWMSGYTKSYLAQKRDIKVHGFGRGILSGSNKYEWKDFVLDSSGNQYFVGNALEYSGSLVAKYTYNFDLDWVAYLESTGSNTLETANGIALDSSNNIYVIGTTNSSGNGGSDAYVAKLDSAGHLIWNKYYGTTNNETGSAITTITRDSVEYIVASVISGSSTVVTVLDKSGSVFEQNRISDFVVNRIRKSDSETDGYFLLAGRTTTAPFTAKVAKAQVSGSTTMFKWVRTYVSGTFSTEAYDIRNTDAAQSPGGLGSQTGPRYVMVGSEANDGFVVKFVVDEDAGNFQSTKVWGKNLVSSSFTALTNTSYTEATASFRNLYVVGHSSGSAEGEGGWEGIVMGMSASGDRLWTNTLGHTGDEKLWAVEWDVTGDNIISTGWSESHTNGRRTFSFRSWKEGLGTGNYHEKDAPGMAMFYQSSSLEIKTNNGSFSTVTSPANLTGGLTALTGSLSASYQTFFTQEYYDGGNLWDLFVAKMNLDDYQEYKNTTAHKLADIQPLIVKYPTDLFNFYQFGTAGDGAADDGNTLGYDLIQMSGSENIFIAGQTSGNIFKTNTGASGVYDYLNVIFTPSTEEFEFYQNGTELDEEVYACTNINDGSGSVAFIGRTTGTLGGTPDPFGSYDIFLGIYNPITEVTTYFQTGSGQADRAVNLHDVGNNTLAVVYETQGVIGNTGTTNGGLDVGVITFNYSSSLWATASYQTGTTEDEILTQEGKPSYFLEGSNRVAIVGTTLGTIADDGERFGNNDIFLLILNLTTGVWEKYQVGTAANDFGTTVFGIGGDRLIVGGFSDAAFQDPDNGIFCVFDASQGIKGKAS